MIYFSEQHAFMGDKSVQQVLVFDNAQAYLTYVKRTANQTEQIPLDRTGAILRLRAVNNSPEDDMYRPIIRDIGNGKFAKMSHDVKSHCSRTIIRLLKEDIYQIVSDWKHPRYQ